MWPGETTRSKRSYIWGISYYSIRHTDCNYKIDCVFFIWVLGVGNSSNTPPLCIEFRGASLHLLWQMHTGLLCKIWSGLPGGRLLMYTYTWNPCCFMLTVTHAHETHSSCVLFHPTTFKTLFLKAHHFPSINRIKVTLLGSLCVCGTALCGNGCPLTPEDRPCFTDPRYPGALPTKLWAWFMMACIPDRHQSVTRMSYGSDDFHKPAPWVQ